MPEISGFRVVFTVILDVTNTDLAIAIAASMAKELKKNAEVLDVWTDDRPTLVRVAIEPRTAKGSLD